MAKYKSIIFLLLLHCILHSQDHKIFENHSQVNLDSGLVLYYPFNSNALDESGNGNHGVVNNVQWVDDRFGNPQSAAFFSGIESYIRIPFSSDLDFSETKQITVGFWADTVGIGISRVTRNFGFAFLITGNPLVVGISASFYWIRIHYNGYKDKKWHYYLFTADEKFISFWLDKELIEQRSIYNVKWDKIRLQDFFVGVSADENGDITAYQKGTIDELRIYNRVINNKEIAEIFLSNY